MTENQRYSDGTLAKWYYSQTNVISDGDNEYYLRNKESVKDLNYNELLGTNDLLDELNKLSDENEQLKQSNQKLNDELQETMGYLALKSGVEKENEQLNQEYLKLKHRHSLLHDVCLDAECERDSLKKDVEYLEKENEQLKKENSIFQGKDAKHYQRWVNQIKKYVEEDNPDFTYDDDFIIKIALSYTLQSVRNGESLKRFQWECKRMTEKRFTTVELPKPNKWGIWYDGAYLSTYQVCILLNEYVDVKKENEQLKQENKQLTKEFNSCSHNWALMYDEAKNKVEELSKENKELKAKVDDKEVAVEVETCKIMEKVFALIDKSLEKDKQYYEMSYEDYLNGRIEALEELKKELQK